MRTMIKIAYAFLLTTISSLMFLCTTAPTNPYDISNTMITLYAQSSSGIVSASSVEDTAGNTVSVGALCNFWHYVDSMQFRQVVQTSTTFKDSIFGVKKGLSALTYSDTVWQSAVFNEMGTKTVKAIAYLNNGRSISDSVNIFVYPKRETNLPPAWQKNTINEVGQPGVPISITLSDKCTDPDGDTLTFSLLPGLPDGDAIAGASTNPAYTFTPGPGDTGVFNPQIVAKDPQGLADTLTIALSIRVPKIDSLPPTMKLVYPAGDNASVSSSALAVKIQCTDLSGVVSLRCSMGSDTFPVTHTDSIYTALVSGLRHGVFDTIAFIAIDASSRANADTLFVHIKYDSTLADAMGPIITKKSGPATNTRTANPIDTLVYTVTDQSGVDTVSWTLNGGATSVLSPDANSQYTIKAILTTYRTNTIIITATDKSLARNQSADTTILDYNVAPRAIDQNLSTKKNTALTVTLSADPIDGDTLSNWTMVTKPVNGDLSGTAPALTYTPKTDIIGIDSLTFTVFDGKNTSNIAKIKINVSDILIAPIAGKTIADIAVNKGVLASFIATVNADANPSPIFSWFKEGSSTSLSANQTYTITQTAYSDQGRYRYFVSNSQGRDSSNWITLLVKDVTKPVIVLKGANPQMILINGTYTELGDSAYDDKDGIITSRVVIDASKVKPTQIGTYPVTYAVKDSAGNSADTMTRSVQIYGNAPAITKISGNKETCINVPAIFSVAATGSKPIKYQWMKGTAAAPGTSTDSTYTITPISAANAGSFYCIVSNGISPDAQSQNMTLTVDSPPAISGIAATPSAMPVCQGTQVAFTVTATGTAPLAYSWKKDGSAIANGPNSATYTINAVAASDSGQYSCTVSNGCTPAATSTNIQLTIKMPPTIITPAVNTTITKLVGDMATLTVVVSGIGPFNYQWYKGITPIGTNSPAFPINPITFGDSGAYTCAVSNDCATATSKAFIVTVSSPPSITTQPLSQTLYLNQSATFTVVATGVPQPTYQWRKNGPDITGATNASYTISSPGISDSGKFTVTVTNRAGSVISDTAKFYSVIKSIAAGANHSLILKTDGRLFGCGANEHGQLGDNSTTDRHSPVQIMTGVQSMSAGDNHSLILKMDGTLFACGGNTFGQLGDGSTTDRLLPVQIMTGVKAISAGGSHSLILMNDGTLSTCGYNGNGQIGNNTFNNQLSPVQITPGVISISAGANFSLIIKSGGTLFAFGGNTYGQLGDGSTANQLVPEQIITGVQSVSTGSDFSLILKTDGTMLACGNNWLGQLGDGTTMTTSPTPEQITTNVQSISAGGVFSLFLKKDGTLFASGNNGAGQFGDGTTNNQSTPVQITNISNAQSMATGGSYSLILKTDGTLSACGDNTYGQLGDGTTNGHLAPFNLTFK